jgi:hypothetical protein
MTTLASWIGVDESRKRVSSLYLVSDSRLTAFGSMSREIVGKWSNEAQKVFACSIEPHIFGYSGWQRYPAEALNRLVDLIDEGAIFSKADSLVVRRAKILAQLKEVLSDFLTKRRSIPQPFSIAHGAREQSRMKSRFHLWISEWSPSGGWTTKKKYMRGESILLYSAGSGRTRLRTRDRAWKMSEIGRKSRGVYAAFYEALRSGADYQSGGAPQLVGLWYTGSGRYFGVVYCGQCYFKGRCVEHSIPRVDRWFNERFEPVDPVSKRRPQDGQPQPKPKKLSVARQRKSLFN